MKHIILCILLLSTVTSSFAQLRIIKDLLSFNVAGDPRLHRVTTWNFDPEAGVRRSRQFQELNGVKASKLIERLGLGIDGYDQERLAKQQARDDGHLDGLNYFQP